MFPVEMRVTTFRVCRASPKRRIPREHMRLFQRVPIGCTFPIIPLRSRYGRIPTVTIGASEDHPWIGVHGVPVRLGVAA
jgi:hypothetical protein